jgi:two-component system phosphate regulon sensor histidine kinase PhoR
VRNGAIAAVTLFTTDITDQKHAGEEAAKRAEADTKLKVMTEFFTNVSHELKTPLSLILMQMDMMRVHLGNEKRMKELLADATLNSYRLTRLVSNLLDITKMDAGFLKLNLRNRDIVSILRHMCRSVSDYAKARKLKLDFKSSVGALKMDLDGDKIERAVLNLLSNAIKYTPEGGKISVRLTDRPGFATISVKDTGVGIPGDKLDTIFDRFVQVSSKMNAPAEGSGIGLSLVRSMVELHGGKVWAESEPGRGSTFTLELPVQCAEALNRPVVIEGFDLYKKVQMELSDLYIRIDA